VHNGTSNRRQRSFPDRFHVGTVAAELPVLVLDLGHDDVPAAGDLQPDKTLATSTMKRLDALMNFG